MKKKQDMTVEELQEALAIVRERKAEEGDEPEDDDELVEEEEQPYSRSPVVRLFRSLPPGLYMSSREVADELGVSSSLIRKMARREELNAPTTCIVSGKFRAYLYTKEDVDEIRQYLEGKQVKVAKYDKKEDSAR